MCPARTRITCAGAPARWTAGSARPLRSGCAKRSCEPLHVSPHGRALRVTPCPPGGPQAALGRPGAGLGCEPPRSLTSCGRCPPEGPQAALGRPGAGLAPSFQACWTPKRACRTLASFHSLPLGRPGGGVGCAPPRSLTSCGRCPPGGRRPPRGGPAPACLLRCRPVGPPREPVGPSLRFTRCPLGGRAAAWVVSPHAPSLRVVAAPRGAAGRLGAAQRRPDSFVVGLLDPQEGLWGPRFGSLAAPWAAGRRRGL